jgi:hypothetical protein
MSQEQIDQIKKKLFTQKSEQRSVPELLIQVHELFISEYGWIPLAEFKLIPMETIFNLIDACERRHKQAKSRIKKPKRR